MFISRKILSLFLSIWLVAMPAMVTAQNITAQNINTQITMAQNEAEQEISDPSEVFDPLESVNRVTHDFNEFLDVWVLQPKIRFYKWAVPVEARQKVSNVFRNLRMPIIFFNSVLQADPENAFSALWTFLLNSTLGIGGIFDFAGTATDLVVRTEDFGQTLGYWGFGEGFYVVLPILGPSNLRDMFGLSADFYADPYNILSSREAIIVRMVLEGLDKRYLADDAINDVYATSLDTYSTFRSAHTQYRRNLIQNNAK